MSWNWNVEHADGSWWAQVMAPVELQGGCEEGAFFHFQTWKRQYKTLAYGSPDDPHCEAAATGGHRLRGCSPSSPPTTLSTEG